jgi:4-hydroxy-3-polyprenylbenzoate decarboxylase
MSYELGFKENLKKFITDKFKITPDSVTGLIQHDADNFFSPPASGSFKHSGMVIAPCSMKTLSAISTGLADNLITRSADICLKEKRPLIIVPRETPLSTIHLKNMQRVSSAGAVVLPAMPGFYSRPETIQDMVDFVVARILNQLNIEHNLMGEWGSNENLV